MDDCIAAAFLRCTKMEESPENPENNPQEQDPSIRINAFQLHPSAATGDTTTMT
jgi:hypothetical protein